MDAEVKDCVIESLMKKLESLEPGSGKAIVEAAKFNNFISHDEYMVLAVGLKNQDGSIGAKFPMESIKAALSKATGAWIESDPCYNEHAMCLAINYVMACNTRFITEVSSKLGIMNILVCYDIAAGMLKDKNRPRWIRKHFGL